MSGAAIPIGIAVVEHMGAYLVGRRGPEGPLPDCDEFPGGKCRPGESPQECALRECREETGVIVVPVELLLNLAFAYPHGEVDLFFWQCRLADEVAFTKPREPFCWIPADSLPDLEFPPANAPLVELLVARSGERR